MICPDESWVVQKKKKHHLNNNRLSELDMTKRNKRFSQFVSDFNLRDYVIVSRTFLDQN